MATEHSISVGNNSFSVELADRDDTRALGLMNRDAIGTDGMLFVMDNRPASFHMKNTKIPLDILYFDDRQLVVKIDKMEPLTGRSTCSQNTAHALELPSGTCDDLGIDIGDKLKIHESSKFNFAKFVRQVLKESAYDRDVVDDLEWDEQVLYSYVRNVGQFAPAPQGDNAESLMEKYPVAKKKIIYRGLMFDTKERYDEFLGKIADGTLETTAFTSWTPHVGTAFQFAATRPSFQITRELSRLAQANPGETLMGKGGIIISVNVSPGDGIDVSQFEHAAEDEVLLKNGTWKIKIVKKIVQFKEMIAEHDINKIIKNLIEDNGWKKLLRSNDSITDYETKGLFDYIFGQKTDQLNQKSRELIGNMMQAASTGEPNYGVKVEERYNGDANILVYLRSNLGLLAAGFFGMPDDVKKNRKLKKMTKVIDKIIREVIVAVRKNPDAKLVYYGGSVSNLQGLAKYGSDATLTKYKKMLRDVYGRRYALLNQPGQKTASEISAIVDELKDIMASITA
tara:strand:+ start:609 stop:2138 length:1530 start_codon:yes stop_codon:yes gene_type:complete